MDRASARTHGFLCPYTLYPVCGGDALSQGTGWLLFLVYLGHGKKHTLNCLDIKKHNNLIKNGQFSESHSVCGMLLMKASSQGKNRLALFISILRLWNLRDTELIGHVEAE